MKRIFVLVSLILLTIAGCVNITQPPPAPVVTPPAVVAFSSSPAEMKAGESATLLWNVTGATSVTIDQGVGTVAAAGTRAVSPTKTTTYTLTATNSAGTTTQPVTLTIAGISIMPGWERRTFPEVTLTETVFDFINEAPSAAWRNSKGVVTFGYQNQVAVRNDDVFGDGVKYPKTLRFSCAQYPDFIEGTYAEMKIPTNAHFIAKVSYAKGVQTNVGVDFCISFTETSSGFVTTLLCKNVLPDQDVYAFDINLASIAGKTGRVTLRASTAPGSYPELYAKWIDTKIIR
jgi:hypothetical protein